MASLEGDNLLVFYYPSASEIWSDDRDGLWWEWDYCTIISHCWKNTSPLPLSSNKGTSQFYSSTRYDYNLTIMKSPKPATDIIYPHIKFWWYRTMLNFYPPFLCHVLAAILKMADILKILKTQNCSSNGDLSLCQNLCLYHYPVRSYQH